MNRFADRVAVVTGGAAGIGLAVARRLAAEGAVVVIADIDTEAAERAACALLDAGAAGAHAVACDVAQEPQVAALMAATIDRAGRLDVVVNNAGVMRFALLVDTTAAQWREVVGVVLDGPFHAIKHALPRMRAGGAIVNVASVHAERTQARAGAYAAAKAGLLSLTRTAAIEAAAAGIRVNAVLPGAVDTAMLWANPNVASGHEPVEGRWLGRPEDVAGAVAYLASADAAFVNGATLRIDGGRGAGL